MELQKEACGKSNEMKTYSRYSWLFMRINRQAISLALLIATFLFHPSSVAQVQKTLAGFQNLPWGTKLTVVKAKYPELKVDDLCRNDQEIQELAKRTNASCKSLSLNNYRVSGIEFMLSYNFDHSERLNEVVLSYVKNDNASGDKKVAKICREDFEIVKSLLEGRYGTSYSVSNPQVVSTFNTSDHLVWLPLPTEILLSQSYGFFDKADETRCGLRIRYVPRRSLEAEKL